MNFEGIDLLSCVSGILDQSRSLALERSTPKAEPPEVQQSNAEARRLHYSSSIGSRFSRLCQKWIAETKIMCGKHKKSTRPLVLDSLDGSGGLIVVLITQRSGIRRGMTAMRR